jgi:hypothetical protein
MGGRDGEPERLKVLVEGGTAPAKPSAVRLPDRPYRTRRGRARGSRGSLPLLLGDLERGDGRKRPGFRTRRNCMGIWWGCIEIAPSVMKTSAVNAGLSNQWARRVSNLRPLACDRSRGRLQRAREAVFAGVSGTGDGNYTLVLRVLGTLWARSPLCVGGTSAVSWPRG